MTGRVVVVGSANLDHTAQVDRLPLPGETIVASDLRSSPGGKGANQAVASSRAGGAHTTFIGAVGNNDAGTQLVAALTAASVQVLVSRADRKPTGSASIVVDGRGENTIVVSPGANELAEGSDIRAKQAIRDAAVIIGQLEIPISATLNAFRSRSSGALAILNAVPASQDAWSLLRDTDVLVVNETEALSVSGAAAVADAVAFLCEKVPVVVVTLGERGSLIARTGQPPTTVPALTIDAIDTTAAGDTFCGVLAAELAVSASVEGAVHRATVAAALAATRRGSQESIPTRGAVQMAADNR